MTRERIQQRRSPYVGTPNDRHRKAGRNMLQQFIEADPMFSKLNESGRIPSQQETARTHKADPLALASLFDEWMRGDETEQRDTFDALRCSLDEGRRAGYKLFS